MKYPTFGRKTAQEHAAVAGTAPNVPDDIAHDTSKHEHGAPELVSDSSVACQATTVEQLAEKDSRWYAYFLTKDFYIVLLLG